MQRFRRRARNTAGAVCTLLALTTVGRTAYAQHLNRAVWLGFEEEGVRRNFSQGTEYFLDRFSYVVTPPWHDRGLQLWGNQVRYAVGSVTSRDFTFEGRIDHSLQLGDGVAFDYHVLQGEHRDARFVRNAIGLRYALDDETQLIAQGTPFADKGNIDISFGGFFFRDGDDGLRALLTLVDAPSEKSRTTDYLQAPYGLQLAGAFGDKNDLRVAFDVGAQLPMRAQRLADEAQLDFERYIATAEVRQKLGENASLVGAVEAEYTDKTLAPAMANDPLREHFHRTFVQARAEYWHDGSTPWSVGLLHTYHRESGLRPNDPAMDLRTNRREWFGIARMHLRMDDKLSFEPQLFAGHVQDAFRDGLETRDRSRFEGKLAWNTRWDFSENAFLVIIVTAQLDELAFGGGGAQFVARF
ncbi:MAG: hypothetical protein AB8H80_11015 [Planctomycetota bacterium]